MPVRPARNNVGRSQPKSVLARLTTETVSKTRLSKTATKGFFPNGSGSVFTMTQLDR